MDAADLIRRLHDHRLWATARQLAAAAALPDDALRRDFPIGQGSIWKSFLHMMAAEYVWLAALEGEEGAVFPGDLPGRLPGNQAGEGAVATFAELRERWGALDERWRRTLASLTAESMGDTVYRYSTSSGAGVRWGTPRADVLMHVVLHAHSTATQVNNMLRHCGAKVPDLMLITLSRGLG